MPAFIVSGRGAKQLTPAPFGNEKELQTFFEDNLDALLGLRFVASEFRTGEKHGGRIDSLGLDEVGNPVIIEYKWDKSDSVINQGLFYLDWLIDHRGDFAVAVQERLGSNIKISWSGPRLIVVAANYTKYDSYAVNQLSPNIELLRYRRYSAGFVVVENVLDPLETSKPKVSAASHPKATGDPQYSLDFHLEKTTEALRVAFMDVRERILALDGVEERANQKGQVTYRTAKSFAAFDFSKTVIRVQLKGGPHPPRIDGIEIKDIRSRQWGYPWLCNLRKAEDIVPIFDAVKTAYDFER